jgi:hypothetical protein
VANRTSVSKIVNADAQNASQDSLAGLTKIMVFRSLDVRTDVVQFIVAVHVLFGIGACLAASARAFRYCIHYSHKGRKVERQGLQNLRERRAARRRKFNQVFLIGLSERKPVNEALFLQQLERLGPISLGAPALVE